jgi:A/G-specific adenine glycosylase
VINLISKTKFQNEIIDWYKKNGRNFPWRNSEEVYRILISELLLQKTDAPKVEEIYNDFFSMYETIDMIYNADIKEIERILLPLGLNKNRANRLKSISQKVIEEHGGEIPKNKSDLLQLKGVGNYIANAVMCFAYGENEPIVDTNVIRMYSRLFNFKSIKKRPRDDKELWNFAKHMLPSDKIQDYNYAILDYASLVCKAKKPLCEKCIFLKYCRYEKIILKKEI